MSWLRRYRMLAALLVSVSAAALANAQTPGELTGGHFRRQAPATPYTPAPTYVPHAAPSYVPSAPSYTPSIPSIPSAPSTPGAPGATIDNPNVMNQLTTPFDGGAAAAAAGATTASAAPTGGGGDAGIGDGLDAGPSALEGSNPVNMVGRADFFNRFNLFDNMSAIPVSRVWFAFQALNNYNTYERRGLGDNFSEDRRGSNQYRFGMELAVFNRLSIAAQWQYTDYLGSANPGAFGNPQFLIKWAMINTQDTVISQTLGVQIPVDAGNSNFLREPTTRIVPGLLVFQALGDDLFFHGGTQYSYSVDGFTSTYDYGLNLGYWLVRNANVDNAGRSLGGGVSEGFGGAVLQAGVYGHHLADDGLGPVTINGRRLLFDEPADVIDATLGLTLLYGRANFTVGGSVPITQSELRPFEFITQINWNF